LYGTKLAVRMTDSQSRFWIAGSAYNEMLALAVAKYPMETGGMLLGYISDNGDAVVTRTIGPGPNAKHGRFRFIPDNNYQQATLGTYFRSTEGRETYLGDWHTHPNGDNALSTTDMRTLARIAKEPKSRIPNPFMVVLSSDSATENWELFAVQFLSAKRRLFRSEYKSLKLSTKIF
jgi:integrative and conjugative element protein (TIGR02256 family)